VTIDLPGHGIHPDSEFTMERALADIKGVLDAVGSAVIVGHSLGGYVAIRVAAANPERVDGLLLAGAAYNWRSPLGLGFSAAQHLQSYLFDGLSHFPRLARRFEHGPADETQLPPPHEDTHQYSKGFAGAIRELTFRRFWPDVQAYDGPTLIIHGDEEPLARHAGGLAARAKANLRWIDGDHYAPMNDSETFTAEVTQFLDEVYADQTVSAVSDDRGQRVQDLLRTRG
jgi:pimeloyl-ACP methyl ester carboxylesterase